MATDSLKFVNESYINRIHGTAPSGKLHKGHNVTAASASIPSSYQTIVIDNSEQRGFLSRSKRFQYDTQANDHPGPGSYMSLPNTNKQTPSLSKKGTGGFASKDKRIGRVTTTYSPGAGAYNLPSLLRAKQDHNKAMSSSSFHKPIAVAKTERGGNPAPNVYNVNQSKSSVGRTNNVTANAAFKSQSKRELLNHKETQNKPSPWQYEVRETLVRDAIRVPVSSFVSKTERQMQAKPQPYPGPGTYKPHEKTDPVQKTVFPRKHYLCISAPAMPLPDMPPTPGPGSYEVVNYEDAPKHYMSSAAFVSTTSRWTGGDNLQPVDLPGPAQYRPIDLGKQSFIYNAAHKWI